MKLLDHQPRWVHENVFVFLCPHCQRVWLSCKNALMDAGAQRALFQKIDPPLLDAVVATDPKFAWSIVGRDFATIDVNPSLNASPSGHWHGCIRHGAILTA